MFHICQENMPDLIKELVIIPPPQSQALETQKMIKNHFEQLHQVLYHEESARLAAVKKEEEEKIAGMKVKMKELSAEVTCLTETIAIIQEQLKEDDMVLLKVCVVQFEAYLLIVCKKPLP